MIVYGTTPAGQAQAPAGLQDAAGAGNNLPQPVGIRTPPAAPPALGGGDVDGAAELAATQQRVQQHVQAFMAEHDQEAHFSFDKSSGMTIVQIVNRASGELVRQIPTEEVVRIAQYLDAQSAFLDVKA